MKTLEKITDFDVRLQYLYKVHNDNASRIANFKSNVKNDKIRRSNNRRATLIFEYLLEKNYDKILNLFENTITAALVDLFDEGYSFKFHLDKHGENTTCDFYIKTGEYPVHIDLRMTQGKSLQEIIATVLRIVIVKLNDEMSNIVILDEPLGGLEPNKQELVGRFLYKISEEFDMQIIMVTQSEEFSLTSHNLIDLRKLK